ncbi:hypothetical protein GCM10007916_00020 [Psychromonas marina]|uniref:Transposase n=1 Tax=Psychromonas marina TaxID=88364 RepID=A0ABQ6DVA7_9GAMM|nr:hypothetical protein GCM10007916_00020 [Psychromonas marina]
MNGIGITSDEALISGQVYSAQDAVSALNVTTSLLYRWKQKAEEHTNSTVNSDELLALCKEVKRMTVD